jgi:hypothetical protein
MFLKKNIAASKKLNPKDKVQLEALELIRSQIEDLANINAWSNVSKLCGEFYEKAETFAKKENVHFIILMSKIQSYAENAQVHIDSYEEFKNKPLKEAFGKIKNSFKSHKKKWLALAAAVTAVPVLWVLKDDLRSLFQKNPPVSAPLAPAAPAETPKPAPVLEKKKPKKAKRPRRTRKPVPVESLPAPQEKKINQKKVNSNTVNEALEAVSDK